MSDWKITSSPRDTTPLLAKPGTPSKDIQLQNCLETLGLAGKKLSSEAKKQIETLMCGKHPLLACTKKEDFVHFTIESPDCSKSGMRLLAKELESVDARDQAAQLLAAAVISPFYTADQKIPFVTECIHTLNDDAALDTDTASEVAGHAIALMTYADVSEAEQGLWIVWLDKAKSSGSSNSIKDSAKASSETIVGNVIETQTKRYEALFGLSKASAAAELEKMLEVALEKGDATNISALIDAFKDLGGRDTKGPASAVLLKLDDRLLDALEHGHADLVKGLFDKSSIDRTDEDGRTMLWMASARGHDEVVKVLIDGGADVNKKGPKGASPFQVACGKGHLMAAGVLLANKADVNLPNQNGFTPLHSACMNGRDNVVRFLINVGAKVESLDKDGQSPLHIAIAFGHATVIRTLKPAEINALNSKGLTLLSIACQYRQPDSVKTLLELGASIKQPNDNKLTPLAFLCQVPREKDSDSKAVEIAKLLLEKGADVNGANAIGGPKTFSPLHYACARGNLELVKYLVDQGADINRKFSSMGITPLDTAKGSRTYNPKVCEFLIEKGAEHSKAGSGGFRI